MTGYIGILWSDIRTIRKAVLTERVKKDVVWRANKKAKHAAKAQGQPKRKSADLLPMQTGRMLRQVIDLMEGDEGFDDVVDTNGDSVMSDGI